MNAPLPSSLQHWQEQMLPLSPKVHDIVALLSRLPADTFSGPVRGKTQEIIEPLSLIACDMFEQADHALVEVFMKESPMILSFGQQKSLWDMIVMWHLHHIPDRARLVRQCLDYLHQAPPTPVLRRMGTLLMSSLATWFPHEYMHALLHEPAVSEVGLRGFGFSLRLGLGIVDHPAKASDPETFSKTFWASWKQTVHPEEVVMIMSGLEETTGPLLHSTSYTQWVSDALDELMGSPSVQWWQGWQEAFDRLPDVKREYIKNVFPHVLVCSDRIQLQSHLKHVWLSSISTETRKL